MERKPYYGSGNRVSGASGRSGSVNRSSTHARGSSARPANSAGRVQARPSNGSRSASGRRTPPATGVRYGASNAARLAPRGAQRPGEVRRPAPRRRKKDPLARLIPLLILAAIVAVAIYVGSAWLITATNRSTYCSNVFVNGMDISKYSRDAGEQYVREQIDARLNTVYTLTLGSESWSFSAADFNGSINTDGLMDRAWNIGHVGNIFDCKSAILALKDNPIYLEAPLQYDDALIDAYVDRVYGDVYVAPQDATVVVDIDKPYLTGESSQGQELDKETLRAQIISLIETGEGATNLPILTLYPALSTEAAVNSLNVIVEYETDTSFRGYNSRFNVRKALGQFHGMTVNPGETIDFNEVVGPRNEQTGWLPAPEFVGSTTMEGYGGGICQASSTLYGAMLKAGMTIISRSPHSMTVSYVDPSIDAAVTETSSKNLIFRNDTATPIRIFTEVTKEHALVRVYGTRPEYRYELESKIISKDTAAVKVSYIDDADGTHCYYENETELYKKGIPACTSEGWLVAYDWDTGEEVSRTRMSYDVYESGTDIYWRGVHSVNEIESDTGGLQ